MAAKFFPCRILSCGWITPTVLSVRFEPAKKFAFKPGQFISVVVPGNATTPAAKRLYSLAGSYEQACETGYELCVKYVPGGRGSEYLKTLRPGDTLRAFGPYGDFHYERPATGRALCFIATGTGIAPLRSMLLSDAFLEHPPERVLCLFGVRHESEVIFREDFQSVGIPAVYAVSRPSAPWDGFTGRVTEYLKGLPPTWPWHNTDFYLCGSEAMITEVRKILVEGHGIKESAIRQESFSTATNLNSRKLAVASVLEQADREAGNSLRLPFLKNAWK